MSQHLAHCLRVKLPAAGNIRHRQELASVDLLSLLLVLALVNHALRYGCLHDVHYFALVFIQPLLHCGTDCRL